MHVLIIVSNTHTCSRTYTHTDTHTQKNTYSPSQLQCFWTCVCMCSPMCNSLLMCVSVREFKILLFYQVMFLFVNSCINVCIGVYILYRKQHQERGEKTKERGEKTKQNIYQWMSYLLLVVFHAWNTRIHNSVSKGQQLRTLKSKLIYHSSLTIAKKRTRIVFVLSAIF
jgi:hypothetical protein